MIHPLIRKPVEELLLRMKCGDAHTFSVWTDHHRVRISRTNYKSWHAYVSVPSHGIRHQSYMRIETFKEVLGMMPGSARMALKQHLLDGHIRNNPLDYTPEKLAAVERWLAGQGDGPADVDAEAVRAFHTLRGAARVVDAPALSELAGALEAYLDALREAHLPLDAEGLGLLREAVPQLARWVTLLNRLILRRGSGTMI